MKADISDNWTELPHYVVMVRDRGGEEFCVGHHPAIEFAHKQAERIRAKRTFDHVRVTTTEDCYLRA